MYEFMCEQLTNMYWFICFNEYNQILMLLVFLFSVLSDSASSWRSVGSPFPVTSSAYPFFHSAITPTSTISPTSLTSMDPAMLSSIYGQMLASHPFYNHELALRSQLMKTAFTAQSLSKKLDNRFHPYFQTSSEKPTWHLDHWIISFSIHLFVFLFKLEHTLWRGT